MTSPSQASPDATAPFRMRAGRALREAVVVQLWQFVECDDLALDKAAAMWDRHKVSGSEGNVADYYAAADGILDLVAGPGSPAIRFDFLMNELEKRGFLTEDEALSCGPPHELLILAAIDRKTANPIPEKGPAVPAGAPLAGTGEE